MSQKLWVGALGGTGIVGVLFVIGVVLYFTDISKTLATFAIGFSVFIAIVLGLLGIVGILKRLMG